MAKNKWRQLVSYYFRKTQRKTIRKIDFSALLKDLFDFLFTVSTVSAGFRRTGVWPFNDQAMREKVIKQCSLRNQVDTNR